MRSSWRFPAPQLAGSDPVVDAARRDLLGAGLAAIGSALRHELTGKQAYQAELHPLRGELLLARDGLAAADEALACFDTALEVARGQAALALETYSWLQLSG